MKSRRVTTPAALSRQPESPTRRRRSSTTCVSRARRRPETAASSPESASSSRTPSTKSATARSGASTRRPRRSGRNCCGCSLACLRGSAASHQDAGHETSKATPADPYKASARPHPPDLTAPTAPSRAGGSPTRSQLKPSRRGCWRFAATDVIAATTGLVRHVDQT